MTKLETNPVFTDKAVGGVGFVGDHKDPAELLQMDANAVGNGMGKFVE